MTSSSLASIKLNSSLTCPSAANQAVASATQTLFSDLDVKVRQRGKVAPKRLCLAPACRCEVRVQVLLKANIVETLRVPDEVHGLRQHKQFLVCFLYKS